MKAIEVIGKMEKEAGEIYKDEHPAYMRGWTEGAYHTYNDNDLLVAMIAEAEEPVIGLAVKRYLKNTSPKDVYELFCMSEELNTWINEKVGDIILQESLPDGWYDNEELSRHIGEFFTKILINKKEKK